MSRIKHVLFVLLIRTVSYRLYDDDGAVVMYDNQYKVMLRKYIIFMLFTYILISSRSKPELLYNIQELSDLLDDSYIDCENWYFKTKQG